MNNMKNIKNMNHITFIDLDETLVKSFAKIRVMKDGITIKELSNTEYNTYVLNDGESFDFSQFTSSDIFETSEPIYDNINKTMGMPGEKIILTARGDFTDKNKFIKILNKFGIPAGHYKDGYIHVVRCANVNFSPPQAKVNMINRILDKRPDVQSISIIDDSVQNLQAVGQINRVAVDLYVADGSTITSLSRKSSW